MVAKTTTTRSRSSTAKRAPSKRASGATSRSTKAPTLTEEAKTAVRSVRSRASRAVKKVPTDSTSLSIAAGVVAGIVAAGVAIFMNRDTLRDVASTSGEKLKKAADELSTMAHDGIDLARDNITKLRARGTADSTATTPTDPYAVNS